MPLYSEENGVPGDLTHSNVFNALDLSEGHFHLRKLTIDTPAQCHTAAELQRSGVMPVGLDPEVMSFFKSN